jgi:isoaspartyl peptidase/L-asparaginase-like protein (Ntn-hydrolase superfamily)
MHLALTGAGERIMVLLSAKRLCDLAGDGTRVEEAADLVLKEIERVATASAGLIALGHDGTIVAIRDTPFMATARRC